MNVIREASRQKHCALIRISAHCGRHETAEFVPSWDCNKITIFTPALSGTKQLTIEQ